MKFTSIVTGAFVALASAAPVEERSKNVDFSGLNNFNSFGSQELDYLTNFNSLDFSQLVTLAEVNNFAIGGFQSLFQNNEFNLAQVVQLAQLQTLLQLSSVGVLSSFDLTGFSLQQLQLGLIENVGAVDLSQFVQQSNIAQIQIVAQQSFVPSNLVIVAAKQ